MHKPAVVVAEDTEAVVATWAALAEATWEVLAEITSAALVEITWRAWAEITLAAEGVISLAGACTTTALVVRITHDTTGRTPAPTEWWANFLPTRGFRLAFELTKETSAHPSNLPNLDAALCGTKVNSTNRSGTGGKREGFEPRMIARNGFHVGVPSGMRSPVPMLPATARRESSGSRC
jgi:hypothetical protein